MNYKIIGMQGDIPFEISKQQINDCIKKPHFIEHIQFIDYLFDESKQLCGLKVLVNLGHGYNFDIGYKELTVYFNETYSFEHRYTSIDGPSDWSKGSFCITFQLIQIK